MHFQQEEVQELSGQQHLQVAIPGFNFFFFFFKGQDYSL